MAVSQKRILTGKYFAIFLAILTALFLGIQHGVSGYRLNYPQASEIKSLPGTEMEDMAFLSLGLRRLGADINFIRLMQYYGSNEGAGDEMSEYSVYGLAPVVAADYEGGKYPELYARAVHVFSLDSYFRFAVLYASGALAFNLNRPEEALNLLYMARRYSPNDLRYNTYIAAIGFSKSNDPEKTADLLDTVIAEPDCPSMVKQLAAFLNKRIKRYKRAYEIYMDLYLNSKDPGYVKNSGEQMIKLMPVLRREGIPVPPLPPSVQNGK
jgi:tetratricopeptide (TPR) repeat protein